MSKLLAVCAAVLLLAGCASTGQPLATPSEEPTPSPSPTIMADEEAATYYLETVCPANLAGSASSEAFTSQDIAAITATAITARDASRTAALRFDDATVLWPEDVAEDIVVIRDSYFGYASAFDTVSKTTTYEDASWVVFGDGTASSEASQRVRARIGLPADTALGC